MAEHDIESGASPVKPSDSAAESEGVLSKASRWVDETLTNTFGKLGSLVARRPGAVLLVMLLVFGASMAGIGQLETENRAEKLWAPDGSDDVKHLTEVSSTFAPSARRSTLLVLAKTDGENVLTKAAANELLDLLDSLRTLSVEAAGEDGVVREWTYADLCAEPCTMTSIFDVYATREQLDAAADGPGLPADLTRIKSLGFVPEWAFESGLGGVTEDSEGGISSATVIRVSITLENRQYLDASNSYVDPPAQDWEVAAVEEVIKVPDEQTFDHIRVIPDMKQYSRLESSRSIRGDIAFVGGAIMLIVVYLILQLGNCTCVGSRVLLSFGGLGTIGAALGSAYGIGALLSPSTNVTTVLPFLIAGIGSDDLYVVINEFDLAVGKMIKKRGTRQLSNEDIVEVMAVALAHAGSSITVTSLTNFAAFAISATTVLPALSSFCIWAAIGIFAAFLYTVTIFASFVVFDARRQSAGRADCLPCIKRPHGDDEELGAVGCCGRKDGEIVRTFLSKTYAPFLLSTPVRVVVLVLFFAWAAVSAWGFSQLEIEFRQEWFIPGDSFLQEYYSVDREAFPHVGVPVGVYAKNFDPALKRDFLRGIGEELDENRYIDQVAPRSDWFAAFVADQAAATGEDNHAYEMTNEEFNSELRAFLSDPTRGARYADDVIFEDSETSEITMMRITGFYIGMSGATEELDAMLTLISDIDELAAAHDMSDKAYAFGFTYTSWRQFEVIPSEATSNVGFAVAAVFVVLLIFIASVSAAFIVTFVVGLALVDVLGGFFFWGLYLDAVSVVQLALAVGLVVDFSAHIAHAVMHSSGTRVERATKALEEMGQAVLNGAISTFLAVLLLSLSQSYIFVVFFKSFFMTCVFGAAHALIFLPVLMSFVAPDPLPTAKDHSDSLGSKVEVEIPDKSPRESQVTPTSED